MPEPVKVTRVQEVTVPGADGRMAREIVVQYQIGAHGPFTLRVPAERFDARHLRAQIEARARDIEALTRE